MTMLRRSRRRHARCRSWFAPRRPRHWRASTVALAPMVGAESVTGAQIAARGRQARRRARPRRRPADRAGVSRSPIKPCRSATSSLTAAARRWSTPTYIAVPLQIARRRQASRRRSPPAIACSSTSTPRLPRTISTPGALLRPTTSRMARVLSERPSRGRCRVADRPQGPLRDARAARRSSSNKRAVNELVKAGSGAILIVHDGRCALTADVIARTGGGLGESVTVYNSQTKQSAFRDRHRPRPRRTRAPRRRRTE